MNELKKEGKEEKLSAWLKDKYNLLFIAIIIFSFILLLYYFNLTKNQTLWWDEAEYMSMAKNWAFGTFEYNNPQRPILFPFLAFLIYSIGFNEAVIKFLLVLLPTFLAVFFTYFLIKEMYDKRTALIASFITGVSWIHLFYAMRFMTDALGLFFGILAFFCFWKGYINNKGRKFIWLFGFFVALSFLSRLTGILYGVVILLFLFVTERFKFLKNKHLWIAVFIFLLTISPYLIWSYSQFGNPFAFRAGYGGAGSTQLGWWMFSLLYDYPELVFFIFFLLGLLTIIPMFLSLDIMLIKKDKKYYNDLFMFLSILFTLAFFIYFVRLVENRWLILMSIGIFTFSAKGILLAYDFVRKKAGKILPILLIILIIASGTYFQLKHADFIIKEKIPSYQPIKEAALWMKENSQPNDVVLSVSYTQTIFYSERKVYTYSEMSEEEFDKLVKEVNPKHIMVSVLEPHHPAWSYNLPEKYQKIMSPAQVWFADAEKQQPILIIYKFNQSLTNA